MTVEQVLAIKKYCEGAYPIMKTDDDNDIVWIDMLKEFQYEGMLETVKRYIKTGNKFPPTLADLVFKFDYELNSLDKQIFLEMELNGEFQDKNQDKDIAAWNEKNKKRTSKFYMVFPNKSPEWFSEMYQKYKKDLETLYLGNKNLEQLN